MSKTVTIVDKSSKGNYYTTGATMTGNSAGHPFCIGTYHVGYASDHFMGMLSAECIKECEKKGHGCDVRDCQHSYEDHKSTTSLHVFCKKPMCSKPHQTFGDNKLNGELNQFLLKLKKKYGKKYDGFTFVREDGKTAAQEYP